MATWLAEFLDKLGTWSNQAWASLEPIMPNVAKIPKDFLEATQQTLYMTFWYLRDFTWRGSGCHP